MKNKFLSLVIGVASVCLTSCSDHPVQRHGHTHVDLHTGNKGSSDTLLLFSMSSDDTTRYEVVRDTSEINKGHYTYTLQPFNGDNISILDKEGYVSDQFDTDQPEAFSILRGLYANEKRSLWKSRHAYFNLIKN